MIKKLLFLLLFSLTTMAQTNLIPNGDFETWTSSSQPDKWFGYFSGVLSQSNIAQSGSSSTNMKIESGTFNFMNTGYFPVIINKTYRVTVYHKLLLGAFSTIDLSIYHKPGTFKSEIIKKTDVTFSNTEWRKIEFEYTATATENIEVDLWVTGTLNSEIVVDNVSVIDVNEVPVQYTIIPDVNFENKLIALGIDSGIADGKVLTSKINTLTSLNLDRSSITDLTGIQDFVALTSLGVYGNKLTSLDISKNTALKSLNCGWNITISTLDVSKNLSLTDLSCYYNNLPTLDVSKNINLTTLACNSNLLTTVDTSNNLALTSFQCFQNKITNLNLTKNSKLSNLECFSNSITSIDVSSNFALTTLDCSYNQLTNLDITKNIKLTKLDARSNKQLKDVNLKNGKNTLIKSTDLLFTGNPSLSCILVDDVAYANTNWASSKDASTDFSSTFCTTPQYTLIPDANFEKSLIIKGIDGVEDGKVLTKKIATVTKLDLSDYHTNLSITDFTGIQDFTDLEQLKLPDNGNGVLTTIDVSKNLKLKKLDCYQNKLTAIDVSKNLALTELIISENKITTLDVTKNLALTELIISKNKITTLDVTKNLALTKLDCSFNRLTTLDVSNNLALTFLTCAGSSNDNANVVTGLLTSLDLSKNIALEYLDVSGDKKIIGFDVSKNINLTGLSVDNMNFETIDFSANVNLTHLSCQSNLLKTLDVTKYPKLQFLSCENNSLTELDLSKLPSLRYLISSNNNITDIDVSKNPLLEQIYFSNNKLTTLDLSQNPNLFQVICTNNDLIKLNLKNGNNTKINLKYYNSFENNANLSCITVDDVAYSNNNWMKFKNATASYNTECGFVLPSTNFTVETKGESCLGENNGEISIKGNANLKYSADINGVVYPFPADGSTLKVTKMAPGTYIIKITINGETFEQSFNVTIAKGATITGKSSLVANKIAIDITEGTAPYTVFVNGAPQFDTNEASFIVDLAQNGLIEVKTAKACEGIYAKNITGIETVSNLSAYPNPTSGSFEIALLTSRKEVVIELYNLSSQLISKGKYTNENGKAKLTLEQQTAGVYIAKVYLDTPEYLKIIKK